MIPILFAPDAVDFSVNGVGRLSEAISCRVKEEKNGSFELELVYPMTGSKFQDLTHSAIILAQPSARRKPQAFRIYKITRPLNGRVSVYARHISYQLAFTPVVPFSAVGPTAAMAAIKSNAATDCPFAFQTDLEGSASFPVQSPASIREILGGTGLSMLTVFGGVFEWDNWTVKLLQSRGQDSGVRIAYGKNLTDINQEDNIEAVYTAVFPYWESGSNRVQLPEKVLRCENADAFPYSRVEILDLSGQYDAAPSVEQLRTYAADYMVQKNFGVPSVSLRVSFVNLADSLEYKNLLTGENVDLCDTVTVEFPKLGVNRQAEIISITWDVLKERYEAIEIGDKRPTLATTIEDQIETISTMPTTEDVAKSINRATGILNAGRGGHAVFNRNSDGWADELLFMDSENYAEARRVLRINMNGIGFSSEGYEGPYAQAWTLDGVLSLGGIGDAYGVLQLLNSRGEVIGTFSAQDGLAFTRGDNVGFQADGTSVYIGDFYVADEYGRQVLQSKDLKTGMSGEPDQDGKLYLWAGWQSDSRCVFLVNNRGEVRIQGTLYYNGEPIEDLIDGAYNRGYDDGYDSGYSQGYADGQASRPTP